MHGCITRKKTLEDPPPCYSSKLGFVLNTQHKSSTRKFNRISVAAPAPAVTTLDQQSNSSITEWWGVVGVPHPPHPPTPLAGKAPPPSFPFPPHRRGLPGASQRPHKPALSCRYFLETCKKRCRRLGRPPPSGLPGASGSLPGTFQGFPRNFPDAFRALSVGWVRP